MARHGGGGGKAFIMAAIGNYIPCASRSTAAVFFARMEVVMRRQGRGCIDEGNNDGGGDVVKLAVTRAGFGWHDESGRGESWTR